jgi:hypothetical protein
MCIACELGYWSMVDALEAERSATKKQESRGDVAFACEPGADQSTSKMRRGRSQSSDEPTP